MMVMGFCTASKPPSPAAAELPEGVPPLPETEARNSPEGVAVLLGGVGGVGGVGGFTSQPPPSYRHRLCSLNENVKLLGTCLMFASRWALMAYTPTRPQPVSALGPFITHLHEGRPVAAA